MIAAAVAAALCLLLVARGPSGTDLAAAVAHADFARAHGLTPVDLRWYGGVQQFGYSLWTQYLTAAVGSQVAGSAAAVLAAAAFAHLLYRAGPRVAPRPLLGSVAGAVCAAAGMVSGRVTYGIGLAVALLALCALPAWAGARAGARADGAGAAAGGDHRRPGDAGRWRLVAAAALALLASAASPVAGLFTGLTGAALLLTGRRAAGLELGAAASVPLAVTGGLFGQGGVNGMSGRDAWTAVVLSLAVLVAVPHRAVRAGAGLSAAGVLVAYAVPSPIGLNATRLAVTFAVPLLLACAPWRLPVVLAAAAGLLAVRLPVQTSDLWQAGRPVTTAGYFAPLTAELARRAPTGRVESVPTRDYWEAVYVARVAPLGRGWLRQQDTERNALFFDGTLSESTYRDWLGDTGVQYVALPAGPLGYVGAAEGRLVAAGLPYLTEVWRGGPWVLYEVAGAPSLAEGAQVVASTATTVALRVAAPGDVRVRVRDSRLLTLTGPGCLARQGRWLRLHADAAGEYVIGSRLRPGGARRC